MWRRTAATEPTHTGCATPQSSAWCHMSSSNLTNHEQTWSKSAQLNTSHLDTAGRTWPGQRKYGGCPSEVVPTSPSTQQCLCTGASLSRPSHRLSTAPAHPADTREVLGATIHQDDGSTFPSTSSPTDLCPWYIHTQQADFQGNKSQQTLTGNLTLKCQQKRISYEFSVKGKKLSKAGRLSRSWCNRDEVLLLTYWSGSLAVTASETFYMG